MKKIKKNHHIKEFINAIKTTSNVLCFFCFNFRVFICGSVFKHGGLYLF